MIDEERAQIEYHAQFRRIVIRTMILIACAALLLGIGRVLQDWQPERRAIPLATGDVLYYRGSTLGIHHTPPGLPRLVQSLPATVRQRIERQLRLAPESDQLTTAEPRLVLWLDDTHPTVTNRTAPLSVEWMLADQKGNLAGTKATSLHSPGGPQLSHIEFGIHPRRDRLLELRAFIRDATGAVQPAGQLLVPNPHRDTLAPQWEGESLPLTRTNGGLVCRLLALASGLGSTPRWSLENDGGILFTSDVAVPGDEMRAAAVFSFEESGKLDPEWTIRKLVLSDATGNQITTTTTSTSPVQGALLFVFAPVLWPDETWRIEARARRTPHARFTSDELFLFERVPVPPEGETRIIDHAIRRGDLEARIERIEHQPSPPDHSSYRGTELSAITVSVRNLDDDHFVDLLEVINDVGQRLPIAGWTRTLDDSIRLRFSLRAIPGTTKTLDMRLAIHRGRSFVFHVQPENPLSNGWVFHLPPDAP